MVKKHNAPKLVAILNVTPDSFSDGARYNKVEKSFEHLQELIRQGADVIDIGAESTRPGAVPISVSEEWNRLHVILPAAIDYVKRYNHENRTHIQISLDSRNYQTISKGLKLGIDIINDVSGFNSKRKAVLAAASGKKIIVMHNLGIPANKNKIISPEFNVIEEVIRWMQQKECELWEYGVKKHQIIFDPGIGFGKNSIGSIEILKNIDELRSLGMPILVGHSKKSFLSDVKLEKKFGEDSKENKTLAVSNFLARHGVEYLRVHDVEKNKLAIGEKRFRGFGF
jgi:dihydropteroate synthase